MKFHFPWVSAFVLDQTWVLNPCVFRKKAVKMMKYFQNLIKVVREDQISKNHGVHQEVFFFLQKCTITTILHGYQLLCSTKLKFRTRASLFEKSQKWWIFFKISENFRKYRNSRNLEFELVPKKEIHAKNLSNKLTALRVPGGNQVDGLPPARHTDPLVK